MNVITIPLFTVLGTTMDVAMLDVDDEIYAYGRSIQMEI